MVQSRTKKKRRSARPLREAIGARIRSLREQQGMPRNRLAVLAQVALTSLVLLEQGRTLPSLETLNKLASTLGVKLGQLLDDEAGPVTTPSGGSKVFYRLMKRLRDRDPQSLLQLEKLIKAFDDAVGRSTRV